MNQEYKTQQPSTKRSCIRTIIVSIMIVLPVLGCCAGSVLYRPHSQERVVDGWVSLGYPPQKVKQLAAAEFYTVYVEAVDGKIYSCYRASPYDIECWIEVTQLPELAEYQCGFSGTFPASPSSVRVIDRLEVEYCSTFAGQTDRSVFVYLLLDDNEILLNGYDKFHLWLPPGVSRKFFEGALWGFLIGCCIAVISLLFLRRKTKENQNSNLINSG